MSASKVYRAFTDSLPINHAKTDFHVTTIINLEDAMWGTSGFVVSEVESSKKEFPHSTLVLDENGTGREEWNLKKKGAALAILDKTGTVIYFTQQRPSDAEVENMLAVVREQIEG